MKHVDLTESELSSVLWWGCNSFGVRHGFERFLKIYLVAIGLDELEVTQRSSDGGVGFKGLKKDVDELADLGHVKYYVQAKRCNPGSSA